VVDALRRFYFLSPERAAARKYADTVVDLIEEVYESEFLSKIKAVVFSDPKSVVDAVRFLVSIGIDYRSAMFFANTLCEELRYKKHGSSGILFSAPEVVAVCLVRDGMEVLMTTAHEFAHSGISLFGIASAFLDTEIPEIKHLLDFKKRPWLVARLDMHMKTLLKGGLWNLLSLVVNEFTADYISFNYFTMLYDSPALDPAEHISISSLFSREDPFYSIFHSHYFEDLYSNIYSLLEALAVVLKKEPRLKEELGEIEGLIPRYGRDPARRSRLERFREYIHRMFIKNIRRMPRDVVVSDPRKYGALFPRDVVEAMKRVGLVRGFPL
jgi:hypothetical protein